MNFALASRSTIPKTLANRVLTRPSYNFVPPVYDEVNYRYNNPEAAKRAIRREIEPCVFAPITPRVVVDPTAAKRHPALVAFQQGRNFIFETFDNPQFSKLSRFLNIVSLVAIVVSTATFLIESIEEMKKYNEEWHMIETIVVAFFSLEYVSRFLCCSNQFKFFFEILNLVDFFAIMPFYLELGLEGGGVDLSSLRVLRVVRLLRVFRVFKMGKHSSHFKLIARTIQLSLDALSVLVFFIIITVIVFGGAIYYAEKAIVHVEVDHFGALHKTYYRGDGQRSDYDPFESIPAACWWAIVTFCTVGYGDSVPVTVPGKLIAGLAMLVGILVVALPVTIVGSHFTDVYTSDRAAKEFAAKTFQTDEDFKEANYLKHIERLAERRKRLVWVFNHLEIPMMLARGIDPEEVIPGQAAWNASEQALFDNVEHDLTTIEQFLLTLPCTTIKTRTKNLTPSKSLAASGRSSPYPSRSNTPLPTPLPTSSSPPASPLPPSARHGMARVSPSLDGPHDPSSRFPPTTTSFPPAATTTIPHAPRRLG